MNKNKIGKCDICGCMAATKGAIVWTKETGTITYNYCPQHDSMKLLEIARAIARNREKEMEAKWV